jgi:tetratricopeptide (TPR) repeat protein
MITGTIALAQVSSAGATNQAGALPYSDNDRAAALQRIERIEQRLDTQQVKGFEDRLNDVYKVFSVMGGLLAVLAVWSFIRDIHQRKDYKAERDFYQQRALKFEKRQESSLAHALKVSTEASARDTSFATQQLKLGEGVLERSGAMLSQQMDNIKKVGDVIELVKTTFEAQKKAQEEQNKAAIKGNEANEKVADLLKGFRKKYAHSARQMLSFETVKAIAWPGMLEEDRNLARRARTSLDAVMDIVSSEEERDDAHTFARILQLMGITAFYDNEFDAALEYLDQSINVYMRHTQRDEDIMARAYSKHFLGLCEKNWQIVGAPDESNFEKAERLLKEAYDASKAKPTSFLIPVTLAEIKSYRTTGPSRREASELLDDLICRMEGLKGGKEFDNQQKTLLVRAYLLRGNLHFYSGNFTEASKCYESAAREDERNPFPVLSSAQLDADHKPTRARIHWEKGLMLLEDSKSGALQKREVTNRVTALAWAILASRALKDDQKALRYEQELDTIGASIRNVSHPPRKPLFFSPISKVLVDFGRLKKEISKA